MRHGVSAGSKSSILIFNYIIRNASFDGPPSAANRAIIPKNIKANKIMNFTASTSLIWTMYHFVHVFSVLQISGRSEKDVSF
jgi:hypothetical protein